ncbi:DUF4252 domain-containing protein [Flavobacterium rhizosphaerae]|uniref:DUF4252 domain-containing protein n=1 Tax=Flavobacterium rhizosphaerae TaxID=3163298 RepID=A0ABW8YW75_9FLAO
MIRLIVTTVLALVSFAGFSQTAFDKFEDREGMETLVVNKEMFEILGSIDTDIAGKDSKEYVNMIKDFDKLKVFTTKDVKLAGELKSTAAAYLKSNKLEELMTFNKEGTKVKIYAKQGNDPALIKECFIFVEGTKDNQVVVCSFTGNINLNDFEKLKKK